MAQCLVDLGSVQLPSTGIYLSYTADTMHVLPRETHCPHGIPVRIRLIYFTIKSFLRFYRWVGQQTFHGPAFLFQTGLCFHRALWSTPTAALVPALSPLAMYYQFLVSLMSL